MLSLVELSRRTGLPKSTVHRIVAELVTLRVLERQESGRRARATGWGCGCSSAASWCPQHRSLSEAALPLMEDLREVTRQRIHLAVLDGVDVVYVEILGTGGLEVASRTGRAAARRTRPAWGRRSSRTRRPRPSGPGSTPGCPG